VARRTFVTAFTLLSVALFTRWTDALDGVELQSSYEASWLVVTALCACVGLLEGRWWVLLLAPLMWAVVWTPGLDAEARGYFLVFGVPAALLGLLAGVAMRKIARWANESPARGRQRPST
jgi:hypothetical protein